MIQHVVLINFRNGVPHEERELCVQRLRALEDRVPGLHNWHVGLNRTTMDRAWDLAITGEFESMDAVLAYRAHPEHLAVQAFVDRLAADTVGADFDPAG